MKLTRTSFLVGSYFFRDGKIVQIDNKTIFVAWQFPDSYTPVPLTKDILDLLPGKSSGGKIKFGEVVIKPVVGSDSYVVGFIDIIGIPTYINKEIKYLHELQKICLTINEEPLEFKNEEL